MTRRGFLTASLIGGAALAACGRPTAPQATSPGATPNLSNAIVAVEKSRPHTGRTVTARLTPGHADIDLGGTRARTMAYNNQVPGPLIRANVGDELAVAVDNGLDHPSSVHWHGIALRNDMDGATPATPDIDPAQSFTYRFTLTVSRHLLGPPAHRAGHRLRVVPAGDHRRPRRARPL